MTVSLSKADILEIKITDMSGILIAKYNRQATEGKNKMNFHLPAKAHGHYILNVFSKANGMVTKKIFVE